MNARFPDNPLLGPLSRADFITDNLPLVDTVVNRHFRSQCATTRTPLADAISEGSIGLINAYDRYNDSAVPFGAFAFPHIYGEIANALSRRPTTGIKIPEWLYPLIKQINAAGLTDEQPEVVAQELSITADKARQALRCIRIKSTDALPEKDTRGHSDDYTYLDADTFLARLKPQPKQIIRMLMADYSQSEVGRALGMSRQSVRATVLRVRENYERYEKISA
ncbi:sigma-70 family RNA polymerase sigma factor [Paenibacillus sp. FSL R5-0636]|uniref:sigma-70 family RNA polymerase sigma factor n=1 Tax=Paenibacillus TaxID=44249 RepID=UPI00096D8BA1|nr:sigma-70 family RNA polymerase sigma factor [Paenibacillus odorifer]OMC96262.1 hypothetical protein BJP49_11210 [Paenibacillus odorifer]